MIRALRADVIRRDSLMNVRVIRLEDGQSQMNARLAAGAIEIGTVGVVERRTTWPSLRSVRGGTPASTPLPSGGSAASLPGSVSTATCRCTGRRSSVASM